VAKAKHQPAKMQTAVTTDSNADAGHLLHDLIWGKKVSVARQADEPSG
jgi:uncharacterized protein (DUF39 family)